MLRRYAFAALLLPAAALAQESPPIGIEAAELSNEPYVFDTGEVHGIEVSVVAKGFARPFAIDFLPGGDLLLAERGGNLRIVRAATTAAAMVSEPVTGMPLPGTTQGNFGLHDVAVHPDFATNGLVFWTWNVPVPNAESPDEPPEQGRLRLMRGRLADGALTDIAVLFETEEPAYPAGTRVRVTADGVLWLTTGAPFGPAARDLSSPYGKVLRLNVDGTIPADNPFAGRGGIHPAIYSYGHRDQHGLAIHPKTGDVFSAEHGPNGGDELNLIKPATDYGWPDYSFGRNYDGTSLGVPAQGEGVSDPLVVWLPSIAPSGLLFYNGDAIPAWRGSLFVGSARRGEVSGTGGLERVVFNEEWGELRRETLLTQLHQRVRDVVQGADGLIYVLTDGPENAILRIAPSE